MRIDSDQLCLTATKVGSLRSGAPLIDDVTFC